MAKNSIIRLCRNIKLDKGYNNCLTYSETEMRDLCFEHTVAMANNFSFIRDNENSIQVPFSYSTCMQANYMCFENPRYMNKWFFAFVDSVEYVSDGTSRINFTIDVFSTWFSYWNPSTCFVVREHVNDDTIGLHTVDEGLNGGDYVVNVATKLNFFTGFKPVLAVSQLVDNSSVRDIPSFHEHGAIFSGFAYIVGDGGVTMTSNIVKKYDELGQSDAIQNIFMCPIEIITNGTTEPYDYGANLKYLMLKTNASYTKRIDGIEKSPTLNGYNPKNNKLFCSPYSYLIFDNNNGTAVEFKYEHFADVNNIGFVCYATISAGCSVKFVPASYHNSNYLESISGGKFPICNWNSDVYTNWLTQQGVNLGFTTLNKNDAVGLGVIGSLIGGIGMLATGNIIGGAGLLAGGVTGVFQSMQSDYKASLIPDQIKGNQNIGDINYSLGLMNPYLYKMSIKYEKAKMIDDFFTRFGYKVNELKQPNQTGRRYFNFVQISQGETIAYSKADKTVPADALQEINSIYQKGVTLWHSHDRIGNYNDNVIL